MRYTRLFVLGTIVLIALVSSSPGQTGEKKIKVVEADRLISPGLELFVAAHSPQPATGGFVWVKGKVCEKDLTKKTMIILDEVRDEARDRDQHFFGPPVRVHVVCRFDLKSSGADKLKDFDRGMKIKIRGYFGLTNDKSGRGSPRYYEMNFMRCDAIEKLP
jgi:hypothetical protein